MANPASSVELHEVLYGAVTPAGPWGWGQGVVKKLVGVASNAAGFGMQAFRNNQPREIKRSARHSDLDRQDSCDFQIGTARSDSTASHPQANNPADASPSHRSPLSSSITPEDDDEPGMSNFASTAEQQADLQGGVNSGMSDAASSHGASKRSVPVLRPTQPVGKGHNLVFKAPTTSASSLASRAAQHQPGGEVPSPPEQSSEASPAGRPQPALHESSQQSKSHEAATAPEEKANFPILKCAEEQPGCSEAGLTRAGAGSSQPKRARDVKVDQVSYGMQLVHTF